MNVLRKKNDISALEENRCGFVTMCFIIASLVAFRLIVLISDARCIFLGLAVAIVLSHAAYHHFRFKVKFNGFLLSYIKDLLRRCEKSELSVSKYALSRMVSKHYLF